MSGASSQLSAFNYAVQPLGNLQIKNITASYTVSPSDSNFILNCTGTTSYIIAMPPASSLPSGFNFVVWNNTTTAAMAVTIDPNASETIDGVTTLILRRGEGTQIISNGSNWQVGNKKTMRAYAENTDSAATRPIASGDASIAIGQGAVANAFGTTSIGINSNSTSAYAFATSLSTAGASYSAAIGLNSGANGSQTVTGLGAMALGGSYASGTDSFAAAIANNTSSYGATGANSVALGLTTKATGTGSIALGYNSTSSSTNSLALGSSAIASGSGSVAIASSGTGWGCSATTSGSIAIGDGALSNIRGKLVYASGSSNVAQGVSQFGALVLSISTTDATPTVLTSYNYSAASTTNQVILPNNSAYAFTGTIIARQQAAGGSNYAAWEVKGAILRNGTAASTVLGSYNINVLSKTAGASAWDLTLSADTTNGGLAVTATGAASVNIRWVATIQTSEVTYA